MGLVDRQVSVSLFKQGGVRAEKKKRTIVVAWSAQFVVSRRRILANPYNSYLYLDNLLSAPADHWIHDVSLPSSALDLSSNTREIAYNLTTL